MMITPISLLFQFNPSLTHRHLLRLCLSTIASIPYLHHPNQAQQLWYTPTQSPQHQLQEHPPLSKPQEKSQPFFISSLIKSGLKKTQLLQIHAHIVRTSLVHHPFVALTFLTRIASSPFQDPVYSHRFLSQIAFPTVYQYNAMIKACSLSDDSAEKGFYFYRLMRSRGVHPDAISSSYVIKSCIKNLYLSGGMQIHARIFRDGHQSDSLLMTSLVDLYSSCNKCVEACKVFDEMSHRDTIAWNVMLSCCINNNRTRDALGFFDAMQRGSYGPNSKPDDVTCLLLLQACAHLGTSEFGERIHSYLEEQGYGSGLKQRNSLIAMYSRCGRLDKAYKVFQETPGKNVVTWSAMISGLAMNGYGRDAIEAFREMQEMGVYPDEQTFTGVLSACSHSGLVDMGMMIFDSMRENFNIVPNVHHYGCMVDLMGRAGSLDQAYQLITSMSVKPDAALWRTLLGACRNWRNVDLGERVIEHLIELKAQVAGDYILLLNMYSSVGNWEKVTEVRRFMKDNAIQTMPGCSTSELRGKLHEFVADDVSHPQSKEIYEMLDEINKQLKIAGYVPEISSELHNLVPVEKGYRLSYHSEKLAIAFMVLSTPPGTPIRVAKNLRTCVDCHNFVKIFSSAYNREVVIRDRSRFHCFREGSCSCSGYW